MDIDTPINVELIVEFGDDGSTKAVAASANGLTGIGEARLKDGDHYDLRIGADLAVGRALAALGEAIAARAASLVVTCDQADVVMTGQAHGFGR